MSFRWIRFSKCVKSAKHGKPSSSSPSRFAQSSSSKQSRESVSGYWIGMHFNLNHMNGAPVRNLEKNGCRVRHCLGLLSSTHWCSGTTPSSGVHFKSVLWCAKDCISRLLRTWRNVPHSFMRFVTFHGEYTQRLTRSDVRHPTTGQRCAVHVLL